MTRTAKKGMSRAIALLALALAMEGCAVADRHPAEEPPANLGVKVESLRLSAAGYMLDLRYRVVDVERARPLFERRTRPLLLEEETGLQLAVPTTPKLGALRSTRIQNAKPGRSYSMIFANPGRFVQPGTRMVLAVGDTRVEGLVVE